MKQLSIGLAARVLPVMLNRSAEQRLAILIYHRVVPKRDPMRPDEPTVEEFDWQMRLLRQHFSPLSLLEAVERLAEGTLPRRAVCVTFDDGYSDNERHALPVLQKYAVPATVFVSTGFLNGGRMWNDSVIEAIRIANVETLDLRDIELGCYSLQSNTERLEAIDTILRSIKHLDPAVRGARVQAIENRVDSLPDDLMMTDEQIQSLALGDVTIGAHTVNHPILASISNDAALSEIQISKSYLEALLQQPCEVFAYPNGKPGQDYAEEHSAMVRELGFKAAVSTHWGVSTRGSDRFQLPRFTPWDRQELKFALRLLASYKDVDPLLQGSR